MLPFTIPFLGSIFGNSVLIHIIRTDNSLKTTINCLILYQAVADLLISVARLIDILLPINYTLGHLWFGGLAGTITCKFYHFLLLLPPVFSVWLLVMIAVERFYAVTPPAIITSVTSFEKIHYWNMDLVFSFFVRHHCTWIFDKKWRTLLLQFEILVDIDGFLSV